LLPTDLKAYDIASQDFHPKPLLIDAYFHPTFDAGVFLNPIEEGEMLKSSLAQLKFLRRIPPAPVFVPAGWPIVYAGYLESSFVAAADGGSCRQAVELRRPAMTWPYSGSALMEGVRCKQRWLSGFYPRP
jgi:hypothetical protein